MRHEQGTRLYSATDLVNFLGCAHATVLDVRQLAHPVVLPPDDEQLALLQEKGIEHERRYLEILRGRGLRIEEIASEGSVQERVEQTRRALLAGADVIYQGALLAAPWHGYSDFLLRTDAVASGLGAYAYEVADTKLSRTARPKHVIQLCVYADLLEQMQGVAPPRLHVVLGNGAEVSLRTADVRHYFAIARGRFEAFAGAPPAQSAGEPCGHCDLCRWLSRCDEEWEVTEHLSLVAGITRSQIGKLRLGDITSMRELGTAAPAMRIPNLQPETFDKLRSQACLQLARRDLGQGRVEVLPIAPGRGFCRLPQPDAGDIFFDMEGDPLIDEGLEYLFGVVCGSNEAAPFTSFWAHDREAERLAFEQAVDFMCAQVSAHPGAHIYHYASYEETALKRLAMYHGTRETEVDNLLRRGLLVDLYQIVREAVRISEPGYSLKNVEALYVREARTGEVTTAGGSIVMYERWRRLGENALLQQIEQYNEYDCRSTQGCRDWLLSLRPRDASWFTGPAPLPGKPAVEQKRLESEARTAALMASLVAGITPEDRPWRDLLGHLLEFHKREAKPSWWVMFTRQEMSEEELVDDAECIGALRADPGRPPWQESRSMVYSFTFPPQDFKMRLGDKPVRPGTLEAAGEIVALDDQARRISLKLGPSRTPLGNAPSLIPQGPIGDSVLREAIYRYAQAVAGGNAGRYGALTDILRASAPRLTGRSAGDAILAPGARLMDGTIDALNRLWSSYMLVQGPPGAGKTFVSSHAIVALLAAGKRIGVASNSHKAINNLLKFVESLAAERGFRFRGVKKSSNEQQFLAGSGLIEDTQSNDAACSPEFQLVAGTAWLFARPELDQALDYLFVDEAGQVSLANIVAMGVSAKNVVLIGDQMQLAQPIQGTHPGGSGLSALQHLLAGQSTVAGDRGIFLAETWRMHPNLCRFISDAVYDGRLRSEATTERQRLLLDTARDPEALAPTGIRFVCVEHVGCSQKSAPEAERLKRTYEALLGQRWIDKEKVERVIGLDDILVVSPYNMQVNLLQSLLPAGARVGTVDKFQGQEAAIVLISMTTSSGEDLPRNVEFLYSRSRINVAISRARCLAVIFANPRLLEISCATIAQMQLVNTLCWAKDYSDQQRRKAG